MKKSQEPKYGIESGRLYNRKADQFIPDDEPVFIFRAKDKNALTMLELYQRLCSDKNHQEVIGQRINDFKRFADENPELMKEPDSALKLKHSPLPEQKFNKRIFTKYMNLSNEELLREADLSNNELVQELADRLR